MNPGRGPLRFSIATVYIEVKNEEKNTVVHCSDIASA